MSATSSPPWRPTSPTRQRTPARWQRSPRSPTRHNDARATLLIGKTALGRGLPLEHYAFPDFGVPNYRQIGPEVERCVVYSIVRQESAFNPRVVSSANAHRPDAGHAGAGPRYREEIQCRIRSAAAARRRRLQRPARNRRARRRHQRPVRGSYILAFAAYNAGPRRAKEWIEQYGDPRDPKVDPIDWIERIPFSETRNYVAARDREHAGLSRPHRQRFAAPDRGRPAPRRIIYCAGEHFNDCPLVCLHVNVAFVTFPTVERRTRATGTGDERALPSSGARNAPRRARSRARAFS